MSSPKPLSVAAFFAEFIGHALWKIPQVAPLEFLGLAVTGLCAMTSRHNSPLDAPFWRTKVEYGMTLALVDWPDEARPEE